jgi:hypothetical protein
LVDNLYLKLNVNINVTSSNKAQKKFFFTDFPKPSCRECVLAFLKPHRGYKQLFSSPLGATGSFFKASSGVYIDFQEALEKLFVAPMRL